MLLLDCYCVDDFVVFGYFVDWVVVVGSDVVVEFFVVVIDGDDVLWVFVLGDVGDVVWDDWVFVFCVDCFDWVLDVDFVWDVVWGDVEVWGGEFGYGGGGGVGGVLFGGGGVGEGVEEDWFVGLLKGLYIRDYDVY